MNKCIEKMKEGNNKYLKDFFFNFILDNRMHVDDNQSQQKQDHFRKYIQNKIENYDQQLVL